jgi:predicted site-specific integrase-resolvase
MSTNKSKLIGTKEVARILGVSTSTVKNYADTGKYGDVSYTTGGQRRYREESILSLLQQTTITKGEPERQGDTRVFLYTRVSSKKQSDDLVRQKDFLRKWWLKHRDIQEGFEEVSDLGSGLNYRRPGLRRILKVALEDRTPITLAVACPDRLARFGVDLITFVIESTGGKVVFANRYGTQKSSEQELAEDLLSVVHVFTARAMGRRRYGEAKKQLEENSTSSGEDSPKAVEETKGDTEEMVWSGEVDLQ